MASPMAYRPNIGGKEGVALGQELKTSFSQSSMRFHMRVHSR
jgi:hypothetical protein